MKYAIGSMAVFAGTMLLVAGFELGVWAQSKANKYDTFMKQTSGREIDQEQINQAITYLRDRQNELEN